MADTQVRPSIAVLPVAADASSSGREYEADLRVDRKHTAADGVVTLELRASGGELLPLWQPGAHIDVLPESAPARQYSLCGDPQDRTTWRIGVLREPQSRGGSEYIHESLQTGDVIRVRGPRNNFALHPSPAYLFIAGGIGITPILPMIRAAEAAGADWKLVYGGRQRSSMAFLRELEAYGERVSVCPQDETGLLDLEQLLREPLADTLVYSCGPEPLLAAVESHSRGWSAAVIHMERFKPKPIDEITPSTSIEVVLSQSGITLSVSPEESILDAVEKAGIDVFSSCREGTCGTCEVGVIDGIPDHRDSVLTDAEQTTNTCMMICVSRACTQRLTLDL